MTTQFIFLVLPQVHLMDLAGPDQVILESIGYGADFSLGYCSNGASLKSSSGMNLATLAHYKDVQLKPGDFLLIPGSELSYILSPEFKKDKELFDWIRSLHNKKVNICSICAGAFVLAQSGLLDGKPCTTHFKRTAQLQSMFPKVHVIENILFTDHECIYTSAGIASGIDLCLHVVEKLMGPYFAHKVAREMVVYNRRNGTQYQQSEMMEFRNHIHSGIHMVQDHIIEHLSQKNELPELAELACMSLRNFTRVFKKETGLTVNEYITHIRKEKIKEYLKNPDITRRQIARKIGLESERQLSRILQVLPKN